MKNPASALLAPVLAMDLGMSPETLGIIAGVGIGTLAVAYFGIRFWLVSTRPPQLQDVHTPVVDRLNRNALEHMAEETAEEDEAETQALQDEESPDDLKAIVPPDADASAKPAKK
jgi:hypothetical protein